MAPLIARVEPESGSVQTELPEDIKVYFDEVVAERVVGTPSEIRGAVLLSPTTEPERVTWRRDHVSVRPRRGFEAGRIYRLEVLPVIADLRNNKMRAGRVIVFSTGPAIPSTTLEGTVVDWVGGRPAVRALVEAVLMPDSLVYRSIADSGGVFRLDQLPPGEYRIYGAMDTNNDRRRGERETYDSVTVFLDSSAAPLELFAFVHDTTGPRLRQVENPDSLTLKLTFDRPLDPTLVLDTTMVTVALLEDSTTPLPIDGVFTQKGLDSMRTAADSTRRAARDSSANPADSIPKPPIDTARKTPPPITRADSAAQPRRRPAPADAPPRTPAAAPAPGGRALRPGERAPRAPLDSTRAEKMLARRPAPTDVRLVRLSAPLVPGTRYVVFVRGVRSLSGNANDARGQLRAPRRPAPRPGAGVRAPADSLQPDSTRRDSIPADTTGRRP